jgi:20S proteasome alpha/beta subunit
MTTIATKDGVLAFDTQLTSENGIKSRVKKAWKLPDGSLFAGSGTFHAVCALRDYLSLGEGAEYDPEEVTAAVGECIALRLLPDGRLFIYEGKLKGFEIDPPYAIGSGAQGAFALMSKGFSAVDAVTAMADVDPNTGRPVRSLSIVKKKAKTTVRPSLTE